MNATLFLGALVVALFFASYMSKRRFGVLAMGLAVGALLSSLWANTVAVMLEFSNVVPKGWLHPVAIEVTILLPAIVLLFHGVAYKTVASRVFGSFLFTVVSISLLLPSFLSYLSPDPIGTHVAQWFIENRIFIVSGAMVIAVIDLFFMKSHHSSSEKKSKH